MDFAGEFVGTTRCQLANHLKQFENSKLLGGHSLSVRLPCGLDGIRQLPHRHHVVSLTLLSVRPSVRLSSHAPFTALIILCYVFDFAGAGCRI
jgi:hypothetical protein